MESKEVQEAKDDDPNEQDDDLDAEEARYRTIAARFNYLAVDRADIQFAVKQTARLMSKTRKIHWRMLRKIGRYFLGLRRRTTPECNHPACSLPHSSKP